MAKGAKRGQPGLPQAPGASDGEIRRVTSLKTTLSTAALQA
jgi:hypothetical protein